MSSTVNSQKDISRASVMESGNTRLTSPTLKGPWALIISLMVLELGFSTGGMTKLVVDATKLLGAALWTIRKGLGQKF